MALEMDPRERLEFLRNMAEADPENEMAHFSIGKVQIDLGDFPAAEAALRRTLELNPRNSTAHRLLAQALAEQGRRDEAVEVLRRGVLIAHEKAEYQVRNGMQEALRSLGAEVPDPAAEERARRGFREGQFACARCGLPNERLAEPPFDNGIGRRIAEGICRTCWREWMAFSIKVINEYRLNLATDQGAQIYDFQMKEFLGIQD
jgi:Fe-S cluster biosynthesis and repair protein YggX